MNKWSELQIFVVDEIAVRHCIQDRGELIEGESEKPNAAVIRNSSVGALKVYMVDSYFEVDKTLDELLRPLSPYLGMDPFRNSLQVRMLGAILATGSPMQINGILEMNGIPNKRGCNDDDDGWLAEAGVSGYSHAWGHPREDDVIPFRVVTPYNFRQSLHLFTESSSTDRRRNWDWPADVGSSDVPFEVIAPAHCPKTDFDPWDDDDDNDENLQYLGELEVARMMEKIPGYKYVPEKNWTSVRRERAGIEPYKPVEGGDPNSGPTFTIPDPDGSFGQAVRGNYKDITRSLKRRPKQWLLDVKASYGPLSEGFSMDWSQFERARKLTWMRAVGDKSPWSGDVLAIIRVSNVGTNPDITFIVDPWQSYHDGELVLKSDGKIKATGKIEAQPGQGGAGR
ncbi:hypothetical protein B0T25DRAFT_541453 [Lasiosphaeria hispida]|uniref:Uncharacterized protein n=1 Tax=Lasiosphaeria hispida TaxID=260671 RepID=A0AAJ0HGZ2_9PEZI|nr:hypothetical protein B0T25DRAFT_541453 [Lasiosphaeria hispida]